MNKSRAIMAAGERANEWTQYGLTKFEDETTLCRSILDRCDKFPHRACSIALDGLKKYIEQGMPPTKNMISAMEGYIASRQNIDAEKAT